MKSDTKQQQPRYHDLAAALIVSNSVSVFFFILRSVEAQSARYWFLLWNLILAWVSLLFVWYLLKRLKKVRWLEPVNVLLTVAWLVFLPNSFYIVSDLIHLQQTAEVSLLYDTVMFMSFILNGLVAGFASLYLIHRELLKRISMRVSHGIVGVILFLSGIAIHFGRNLRWNSWDVVANPAALVFDVSEQVSNPVAQSPAIVTTLIFFLLFGSIYMVIWQFMKVISAGRGYTKP